MPASTNKRAVVRRFEREPLAGFVNPASFLQPEGVEVLSEEGRITTVPYKELRTVSFVRDFDLSPEPARRVFHTRPKMAGLWVSLEFQDGGVLEGILPNDLRQIDPPGFMLIPPDPAGNTQRVFIPRAALRSAQVLGVVGSPLRRHPPKPVSQDQIRLFEE